MSILAISNRNTFIRHSLHCGNFLIAAASFAACIHVIDHRGSQGHCYVLTSQGEGFYDYKCPD